ncbi:MAG: phosphinothricin acetyltransferase [Niastella sp. SCN 39-18]|nr:N-acetyltransferase [Sphingobacteriales bacterium]ODT49357.1 MAG: phosphinothricin acetyltransferase [Niastella sp. SCN 39-18]OJW10970.1 MAG: N-acetyltransferase [Sphingobacteriales bacterium 39-19]
MLIRNAYIDDLPYIVEIYNSTIASRMVTADTMPVNTKDKEKWFWAHTGNRPIWIIEDDLQFSKIGWVSFSDFYGRPAYSGTAEISIFLDEKCRGKGYGKAILSECIKEAPALKIKNLLGFIFAHNYASLSIFKSLGFETWGHLPDVASMDGKEFSLIIMGKKTG